MKYFLKLLRFTFISLFSLFTIGVLAIAVIYLSIAPQLPSIDVSSEIHLQVPLRVYTRQGALVAEFGEKRRSPLKFKEIPDLMVKAMLAAEDDRFYEHPGVYYQGIMRAIVELLKTGKKRQGGSTITMQVARNFFLSPEKTYLRKLNEIFLALKIEREFSKEEILELYFNKIYLGNRAYGVAVAANVYYGFDIDELTLPQLAMIAGLPKAPSRYNPIVNPSRALARRNYVLGRMHQLGFIDDLAYEQSVAAPVTASYHGLAVEVEAPYVAEMVRAEMVRRFGDDAYRAGYNVTTTIDGKRQKMANSALRKALLEYDHRHGYRGPEGHIDLQAVATQTNKDTGITDLQSTDPRDDWMQQLGDLPVIGGLMPGLVLAVHEQVATVLLSDGNEVLLEWGGLSWAKRYIDDNHQGPEPAQAAEIVQPGDIVRLQLTEAGQWYLSQKPVVEGALVSLAPKDGAVNALVGGFDFYQSKFNRVTQARRQPGSNFKPFIYSAALAKGFTPASIINDAPVVFDDPGLESAWRPENYSGKFFGPTRLRIALAKSRNLVSIRLLREIGIKYAVNYIKRFGFRDDQLPRNLSLALGSGSMTPLELASGYTVLANTGYRVEPYFIDRITGSNGEVIFKADPFLVCTECEPAPVELTKKPADERNVEQNSEQTVPGTVAETHIDEPVEVPVKIAERVITPQNHYLIVSMMRDVIKMGTGRRALQLGRKDLAGKTGTTNEQRDAWFSGFNSDMVTVCWTGFDQGHSLGDRETGARAALPMWMAYMRQALKGIPERPLEEPPGLVTVRIDPETGLLAHADQQNAIFETFRTENVPKETAPQTLNGKDPGEGTGPNIPEQLF